jgi:hypothetical protein
LIKYFEGSDAQDRFVRDPLHATKIRIDRPVDSLIASVVCAADFINSISQ